MQYDLQLTDAYLNNGFERLFDLKSNNSSLPANDSLSLISSIPVSQFIPFLESTLSETAFSIHEYAWIIFGEEFNEDNTLFVPENSVGLFILEESKLVSKSDFFGLCILLARKGIEAESLFQLKEKNLISDNWTSELEQLIPRLISKQTSLK